jgi:hypothetical protein
VLFRLDYDSQAARKTEEEMYRLLETSVPGLVLQRERTKEVVGLGGKGVLDGAITGHKLLVSPDPFNMVYLLPPTISFLDRVKELIPYIPSSLSPRCAVFVASMSRRYLWKADFGILNCYFVFGRLFGGCLLATVGGYGDGYIQSDCG